MSNSMESDTVMHNKRKCVKIDENIEDQKKQRIIDDVPPSSSYLPEDLILENILTRVSAKDIARFTSVSKSWYSSIFNDTQFAMSHFARHRNRRNLSFNLLNVSREDDKDDLLGGSVEPVGNCNGLACVKCASKPSVVKMSVLSSFRKEALTLTHITPEIGGVHLAYLCHGFGFDSLSQEYKIVVVYKTRSAAGDLGLICMVITLGESEWRKIVISPSEISPPPGRSSFPSPMSATVSDNFWEHTDRSATICGGDLLWRIAIISPDDNYDYDNDTHEIEMLLSFDVHNEKIQFIRPPNKCNSLITAMNGEERRCLEFRHHLLEFKGYPCVARTEKTTVKGRVGTQSNQPRFLCYQFKVQLYILTDKLKQIWTKEETFDVSFMEDGVNPSSALRNPFERHFYKTEHSNNHLSHRTRMFSFSDQVMLYWFDGRCLIFYNLRQKHHNVINGTHSCNKEIHDIFEAKIMGLPHPDSHYDVSECPSIDYQLHTQVENIISLKAFIPKGGEVGEFDCYEEFQQFVTDKQPTGWLDMGRKSPKWYAFS